MTRSQRLNYDQIAASYDDYSLRQKKVDPHLQQFLSENEDLADTALNILDVGCGTGNQLIANQLQIRASTFVGLDASFGMLRQARMKSQYISWVQADGAFPPFAEQTFHYITNQFSYHHFNDKAGLFAAIFRLLLPGGRFVLTNLRPEAMQGWLYYRFFPAALDLDQRDFLDMAHVQRLFSEAGFDRIELSFEQNTFEQNLGEFQQQALERYHCSQLMALPDEDYQAGMQQLDEQIAQAGEQPVSLPSEVCVMTLQADRPI